MDVVVTPVYNGAVSVSEYIESHSEDKEKILSLFRSLPAQTLAKQLETLLKGMIDIDTHCFCNSGEFLSHDYRINAKYSCTHCRELNLFTDFSQPLGKSNSYIIRSGKYTSMILKVLVSKVSKPSICSELVPTNLSKGLGYKFLETVKNYRSCDPGFSGVVGGSFLSLDSLSTEIVMNVLVEDILKRQIGTSLGNEIVKVAVCNDKAVSSYLQPYQQYPLLVQSFDDIPSFSDYLEDSSSNTVVRTTDGLTKGRPFKEEYAVNILRQIVCLCHILREYSFVHNTNGLSGYLLTDTPCSFVYDSVKITSPFTITPAALQWSSLNYGSVEPIQIVNSASKSVSKMDTIPSDISISKMCLPTQNDCSSSGIITTVKFNMNGLNSILTGRSLGVPILHGVLEMYSILWDMFTHHLYAPSFKNNPTFIRIWNTIWHPDEVPDLDKIKGQRGVKIFDQLAGKELRCDIIAHMWASLKDLQN